MRGVEAQDLVGPGRSDASVREVHLSGASDKGGRKRRRALHGHPFGHISKKRVRQARFRMPTLPRGDVFTAGGRSVGLGVTTTDDTERAEAFRSEEARKEGRGERRAARPPGETQLSASQKARPGSSGGIAGAGLDGGAKRGRGHWPDGADASWSCKVTHSAHPPLPPQLPSCLSATRANAVR